MGRAIGLHETVAEEIVIKENESLQLQSVEISEQVSYQEH